MVMGYADPFETLLAFQRALENRLSSDWLGTTTAAMGTYPPINVFQQGDDLIAIVELPGVNKGDLNIQAKENTIRIAGQKMSQSRSGPERQLRRSPSRPPREGKTPSRIERTRQILRCGLPPERSDSQGDLVPAPGSQVRGDQDQLWLGWWRVGRADADYTRRQACVLAAISAAMKFGYLPMRRGVREVPTANGTARRAQYLSSSEVINVGSSQTTRTRCISDVRQSQLRQIGLRPNLIYSNPPNLTPIGAHGELGTHEGLERAPWD